MKSKLRYNNYDMLRVIATIAVIVLHTSAYFISAITDASVFGEIYTENMLFTCIVRAATTFAVPCFMMLSGALLLEDEKNADYVFFYKKRFKSIGVPTVIFSVAYTIFSFGLELLQKIRGRGTEDFFRPIYNLLIGEPYYHMWYLFMLLGVYVMVPVILHVKTDIGEKKFAKMSVIFFLLAYPSGWTIAGSLFKWNIGYSFCFLGYLMIGYTIHKWSNRKQSKGKGVTFLLCGIGVLLIIGFLQYEQGMQGIANSELKYSLLGPFNPLVVLASVLIFAGVSMIEVKKDFSKLSNVSFYIYLFHAGILVIVRKIVEIVLGEPIDSRVFIILSTILTFVLSWIASELYIRIFRCVESFIKNQRTKTLC